MSVGDGMLDYLVQIPRNRKETKGIGSEEGCWMVYGVMVFAGVGARKPVVLRNTPFASRLGLT